MIMVKRSTILVSIIVTTRNEQLVLGDLLQSIKKQIYKNWELIVVDNNSNDQTKQIASKYTKKVINLGPERSAQRNYGANLAKGEYLLFLDADMRLSSQVVEECVRECNENKSLSAVVIPEESIAKDFWGKVKAFERSFYNINGDPITDAARFFKKPIFFKVGQYDESITGPEDWDLPDRVRESGYKIGRILAKIYHQEGNLSLNILFRKKFYYGLRADRYLKKHQISVISPKTIYFLRPLFYKNWYRLLAHPILAIGMIVMLMTELAGGGLGYLTGRIRRL